MGDRHGLHPCSQVDRGIGIEEAAPRVAAKPATAGAERDGGMVIAKSNTPPGMDAGHGAESFFPARALIPKEPARRDDRTERRMNDPDMELASGIAAFEAKEFRRAFQLLAPLAARGEAEAQFRVGVMSRNGLGGAVNEALAFSSMRDAAQQGHGLAQHGLGVMYLYGECVAKDEREAAEWFRRAAAQGLAGAMMTLGMMYEQGLGVERDPEQAMRLYALAESGDAH